MGRAFAMVLAGIVSAPRVGRSARRWRSPGSGGANRLGFSAAARRDVRADGGQRVPAPKDSFRFIAQ